MTGRPTIESIGEILREERYTIDVHQRFGATCAVTVIRDGQKAACGEDCDRRHGGVAEDGEGGRGSAWWCPTHGPVAAQLRASSS